jgi:hypothetical protein
MNPNSWIQPMTEPAGTFALAYSTPENANTPLEPFASSGGSLYYSPDTSRMPNMFGYTYPEIPNWNIDPTQLAAQVTTQVHNLYNPSNQFKKRADGDSASQFKEV